MPDETLTAADQKFYEWFHVHGSTQTGMSVSFMRTIFMAGWTAATLDWSAALQEQESDGE